MTPPIASEPYTAEAPSVSTSMRSTAAVGIELMSTPPPWKLTTRWPSTSTKVRLDPKPRRPTRVWPEPPPLLTRGFSTPPVMTGRFWITSPSVSLPVA